jgi:biotin carboxyl carrier protein
LQAKPELNIMSNLTKILTAVLLIASVGLFVYLYGSVQKVIDDRDAIATKEAAVIERLKLIREAENVYQEAHGKYTANWDSLADFIEHGRVPILERREEIKQKAYGGEEIILHVDTLGYISAKERIFKKNYTTNASDNGTFVAFRVKVGDQVIRNQKAYAIRVDGTVKEAPFTENGFITSLANVNPGDQVKKGQNLINYWNNQFNPNVDLKQIGVKPGTDYKFDIFVGTVDKSGNLVQVIEVRDPRPDNPARSVKNEQKPRQPLHFGSRTDVSTAGNWE